MQLIATAIGRKARLVHLPPVTALALTKIFGIFVHDRILTREEIDGLMAGLLVGNGPPTGKTRLSDWLATRADLLGSSYASELARHYEHV